MIKEEFCGICAAIPVALMGAGASATGLGMEQYREKRKWMLIIGVASLFLSIFIVWWNRDCTECRV